MYPKIPVNWLLPMNPKTDLFVLPLMVHSDFKNEELEDPDLLELNALNSKETDIFCSEIPYNMKMMIQECEAWEWVSA